MIFVNIIYMFFRNKSACFGHLNTYILFNVVLYILLFVIGVVKLFCICYIRRVFDKSNIRGFSRMVKLKQFDQIDYKIIEKLSIDARMSANAIAKDLEINERTVRRRIENLVNSKAIRFSTIIEPSVFGYMSVADINLFVDPQIIEKFVQDLKKETNVSYIAAGWGKSNLSIETRFKDNEEMYEYINKHLPSIEGVEVINFFIIPKIVYNIDQWKPKKSDFIEKK